jgi:hypothetical protein
MIIKTEVVNGIKVLTVKEDLTEREARMLKSTQLSREQIPTILREDCDVFVKLDDGELRPLLKFRKNVLTDSKSQLMFDNVIKFARNSTTTRGTLVSTTGFKYGKSKGMRDMKINKPVKSNMFGFFDQLSPAQKYSLKLHKQKLPVGVRLCRFNRDFPEEYKKTLPLISEINSWYKKLLPRHFELQNKKAQETPYHIADTAFTTITTNVNVQTSVHSDKGDDKEGFGNLTVVERGKYEGAETCMPRYGIGVDVRTNDVLFMDVHEFHGNLPIVLKSEGAERLSIVCYLRYKVWLKSKGLKKIESNWVNTRRTLK